MKMTHDDHTDLAASGVATFSDLLGTGAPAPMRFHRSRADLSAAWASLGVHGRSFHPRVSW